MSEEKRVKYLKMKSDVIFKRVMLDLVKTKTEVFAVFLECMLGIDRKTVNSIEIRNTELLPKGLLNDEKLGRLDIHLDVGGRTVNLEMQVAKRENYRERSMFYWSRLFGESIQKGDDYSCLPETVCANFLAFTLFPERKKCHSVYKLLEEEEKDCLSEKCAIHFFEMGKRDTLPKDNEMRLWLSLLDSEKEEEIEMIKDAGVKEINETIEVLERVSADDELRELYEYRESALHDYVDGMNSAEKRGREEGKEEGIAIGEERGIVIGEERGREKERRQMIELMRLQGISEDKIQAMLDALKDGNL